MSDVNCHAKAHRRPVPMHEIGTADVGGVHVRYYGCPECDRVRKVEEPTYEQPDLFTQPAD